MARSALITGGHGFAGSQLVRRLSEATAPSRADLDLRDAAAVRQAVAAAAPDSIFHLGALASVRRSWEAPEEALVTNQQMTLNLLEAVRHEAPGARVVLVSSGEVYGRPDALPLTEDAPLRPQSPYAVSKVGCDLLGGLYADAHGLHVVRMRPFNHAGPGQSATYVISSLARQIAAAETAGADSVTVVTGNPKAARDFTDVRDVVRAYELALDAPPGAYNIASETSRSVEQLLGLMRQETQLTLTHEVDPALVRDHEVNEVRASAARLRVATGWEPEIPLEQTLRDALNHWRRRSPR